MTRPTLKRQNRLNARTSAEKTIKPKWDLGPWENLTVTDCDLIKQAVGERWDVCAASRVRLVDALSETMKSSDDWLCLRAGSVIIEMVQQDEKARFAEMREHQRAARRREKEIRKKKP